MRALSADGMHEKVNKMLLGTEKMYFWDFGNAVPTALIWAVRFHVPDEVNKWDESTVEVPESQPFSYLGNQDYYGGPG